MAIPITEYIDITSTFINPREGERDFSGLIFTEDAMKTSVPVEYSALKTAYDNGDTVLITRYSYASLFETTTLAYKFALRYFSYSGGNKTVSNLYVAKILAGEDSIDAYNRAMQDSPNPGTFTFLGTRNDLVAVSTANKSSDKVMVVAVAKGTTTNTYDNNAMTHVVVSGEETGGESPSLSAWMPMSWYASVSYSLTNASATIDYKQFGDENASVDTLETKVALDEAHMNYIGLVQANGKKIKFYQRGVNCDGKDLGVIRDKVWIEGRIANEWFTLASSSQKIPASYVGSSIIRTMVIGVANEAVKAGAILIDKQLTDSQIAQIKAITNADGAVNEINQYGFFVDTNISYEENKYIVQYTLIYAKGDHIEKVYGTHYLV